MIIERRLTPYLVFPEDPLLAALRKMTDNRERTVFVVDSHGFLVGSLTDGDVRRWLLADPTASLDVPAADVAHPHPATAPLGASPAEMRAALPQGAHHLPLLDERGRLAALAIDRAAELRIGEHRIGEGHPAFLIAEIGNNHQGDVDLARRLVDLAVEAGADAVKFQLRDMDALYRQSGAATAGEDLGAQRTLDELAKFSLSVEDMVAVFDHVRDAGVALMCTPWDAPSMRVLAEYPVDGVKIASADLTNHGLLRDAAASGIPMVLSTGMSREEEIHESAALVRATGMPFAMLHAQSTYPASYKDVNLAYLDRLAEIAQAPVGYSGHERGFHVALAAVARGASIIEKHVTVDRGLEGNDHKVSLLPEEFAQLVRQTREIEESIGVGGERVVSTGEAAGIPVEAHTRDTWDLTDPDSWPREHLRGVRAVVNASAMTAVDAAETPDGRAQAWAVNATGVAELARRCTEAGVPLAHVSTDYVFDGALPVGQEHPVDHPLAPLGVYGQSKAAGEAAVRAVPRHWIVRTSWVIGEGKNFVATMASLAERGIDPAVVADQHGRLTFADDLADALLHLVTTEAPAGTYHMTNSGDVVTWHEVARWVFADTGHDAGRVRPVTTAEYTAGKEGIAPRPVNGALDLGPLAAVGYRAPDQRERLREHLRDTTGDTG